VYVGCGILVGEGIAGYLPNGTLRVFGLNVKGGRERTRQADPIITPIPKRGGNGV
jgi:hypothetical protein